jgi:hypothetical protein
VRLVSAAQATTGYTFEFSNSLLFVCCPETQETVDNSKIKHKILKRNNLVMAKIFKKKNKFPGTKFAF